MQKLFVAIRVTARTVYIVLQFILDKNFVSGLAVLGLPERLWYARISGWRALLSVS